MTVQKRTGRLFSIFTSLVIITNIIDRIITKRPMLEYSDLIFLASLSIFLFTIFYEYKISKILQIVMLTTIGVATCIIGNPYFGIAILSVDYMLAYYYEFYNKYKVIKISITVIIAFILFYSVRSGNGMSHFLASINFLMFAIIFTKMPSYIWNDTFQKCYLFERSKEKSLEEKIRKLNSEIIILNKQMKKLASAGLEAVEVGKELLNERK